MNVEGGEKKLLASLGEPNLCEAKDVDGGRDEAAKKKTTKDRMIRAAEIGSRGGAL